MKYSIVIPCFNEADNLELLLQNILPLVQKYDIEFILVENGSTDMSKTLFRTLADMTNESIVQVYIKKNRGYGYGLLQGLKVCQGEYVGWIHADMQVPVEELIPFLNFLEKHGREKPYFLKGIRKNRNIFDLFFTSGMSIYETILFKTKLYDIGGIPVIFHRQLLHVIENAPYDFLIELFVYYLARKNGYVVKRHPVMMVERKHGNSNWNKGVWSKIKTAMVVTKRSIVIAQHIKKL